MSERRGAGAMISYPGDIVCRFGRYEAIEDLGASGRAHLWGAWDPYLDRFVVVVDLGAIDPAQLLHGMRDVAAALAHWTANKLGAGDLILDFSPGTNGTAAFLVIATTDADDDAAEPLAAGPVDDRAAAGSRRRPAGAPRRRARHRPAPRPR